MEPITEPRAPLTEREPVRIYVLVMSLIAGLGVFFGTWGGGVDWRVALGMALGAFAAPAAGGEVARSRAWAPATVDDLVDAEAAIAQLQGLHPPQG